MKPTIVLDLPQEHADIQQKLFLCVGLLFNIINNKSPFRDYAEEGYFVLIVINLDFRIFVFEAPPPCSAHEDMETLNPDVIYGTVSIPAYLHVVFSVNIPHFDNFGVIYGWW